MQELVHYNAMRQALIKAHQIDEVKDLRDRAESLRAYAKQAGESLENQNLMAEIKLRAERRAGEILQDMEKAPAGRKPENRSHRATDLVTPPTLAEVGITKSQSSRWQAVAKIPEEVFEEHIAEVKASKHELTSVGVQKLTNEIRRAEKIEKIVEQNQPLEDSIGPFNVIYADPPWRYEHSKTDSRQIENQYPTRRVCAFLLLEPTRDRQRSRVGRVAN